MLNVGSPGTGRRAVIFDMDGTLLDSERVTMDCYLCAAAEAGVYGSQEIYCRTVGISREDALRVYVGEYGEAVGTAVRDATDRKLRNRIREVGIPPKPGAEALLTALAEHGDLLVLASSSGREQIGSKMKRSGLLRFFSRIVSGDNVTHAKPDPEIFEKAAACCTGAEEILVVEDSPNGIRAAAAAGLPALLVPDLIEPDAETAALAAQILPDLYAVRRLLLPNI